MNPCIDFQQFNFEVKYLPAGNLAEPVRKFNPFYISVIIQEVSLSEFTLACIVCNYLLKQQSRFDRIVINPFYTIGQFPDNFSLAL